MEDVTKFLKNIFEVADVNSDGFLTKIEVKQILQRQNPQRKISRSEVTMMMKQMDVNNDGKISFEGNSLLLNLRGWKTADKDAYWFSFEVSLFSPISNENLPRLKLLNIERSEFFKALNKANSSC